MSKKTLATFTLAVAGAGFMPGAAVAHAAENTTPNTWTLPSVSAVDSSNSNESLDGGKFTVTVETRDSVTGEWKDITKDQKVDDKESKEQQNDAVLQAQKLVGTPSSVDAAKEEDSLLRVTYKQGEAPSGYADNNDSITLYEETNGWVQGSAVSDEEKAHSDDVTFAAASDDKAGEIKFLDDASSKETAEVTPTAVIASPTSSPSASSTAASASSSASSTSEASASSTASSSSDAPTAEASIASATPSKSSVAVPSSTPTQAVHKLSTTSPLALPKTGGFKAADQAYSIDGTVFTDSNRNGAYDSSEKGAGQRTVVLKNEIDNSVVGSQVTDASGHYSFNSLQKGTYDLTVTDTKDSKVTSVWGNTSTDHAVVILNDTMTSSSVDFGVGGGTVKKATSALANGDSPSASSSPSASASPTATATQTPTATPSTNTSVETSTSTETAPATTNTTTDSQGNTVVNSGEVPNSVNGGALAAGFGLFGGAGVLARLGLRRKR